MSAAGDPRLDPDRVYAALLTLHPAAATAPLCVAFSGGADSTALLGLLAAVPAARGRLRAVHIDHGLQAQSGSWARACRARARELKVPFATHPLALTRGRGQSIEALARAGRYAALARELRAGEVLLTAHHLEDQLETVLLQLLRGAGLPGLAAMPAVAALGRGFLVRPLLDVRRERLRAWAQERGLRFIEDPSNRDDALDRNYLRHEVLPGILTRWPGAAGTVARAARHIAQAQQLLDALAAADSARAADGAALAVSSLRALPPARRRNALRWWISQAGHTVPDSRRLEEIAVTLLAARVGANPWVSWGAAQVQRHAGRLTLTAVGSAVAPYEIAWSPRRSARLILPGAGHVELVAAQHGLIDAATLPARLLVRTRRGGERLRPRAAGPSRTLKSLLQKEAIGLREREMLPLLYAGEQLVAVADLWVDARWQPRPDCARRLQLIWHRPA
ncbi:MAG TPA: tRNA lysidine(34) synthetase TilS [Steroidobacteraceae bacterium]|nr:tRNA lysidine(34) synthetase TilS [Steroidobacteraceae bacterium]